MAAGLARGAGLQPEQGRHDAVGLLPEHGAHEARVAAALDVVDQLDGVPVLSDNVLTRDVRLLRVDNVLDVPEPEAALSLVDVRNDGAVQGSPQVVLADPRGQFTFRVAGLGN